MNREPRGADADVLVAHSASLCSLSMCEKRKSENTLGEFPGIWDTTL